MDPNTFMAIAEKHYREATHLEKAPSVNFSEVGEKYLIVIIMAAAAIEAQVNLMMALPAMSIENEKLKMFYAQASIMDMTGIRQKLKIIKKVYKDFGLTNGLVNDLGKVASLRNRYVHSSPELIEARYIPEDVDITTDLDIHNLPTRPHLGYNNMRETLLNGSTLCINTAGKFLTMCNGLFQGKTVDALRDPEEYDVAIPIPRSES